ncbi:cytochrome c peroxidase [Spirosomataceae bacterium TFI 002]|nr:cytochrome c peroxidase [Spirosomataceae bacterium TFI 002]
MKTNLRNWYLLFAIGLFIWSCQTQVETTEEKPEFTLSALPVSASWPLDNPYSDEKVELGKLLFFDPILSGNKDVACASCHHPEFGFAESLELSMGVNAVGLGSKRRFLAHNDIPFVKRNSQTILNTAFNGIDQNGRQNSDKAPMFWDLRVESLEKQALEPIKTLEEMKGRQFESEEILDVVVGRLKQNKVYEDLFSKAFEGNEKITVDNLGKAIAAYERTLITPNTRFDQYMNGDRTALSYNEIEGMKAFVKSGCINCHNGPMLSDFKVHALGVEDNKKLDFVDDGFEQTFAFRTPTLRNLRYTFPYMHNGKLETLKSVLEFYEDLSGGKIKNKNISKDQIDPLVKDLKVNFKDLSLIEEFLNSLNADHFDKSMPESVPSGLKVGGEI